MADLQETRGALNLQGVLVKLERQEPAIVVVVNGLRALDVKVQRSLGCVPAARRGVPKGEVKGVETCAVAVLHVVPARALRVKVALVRVVGPCSFVFENKLGDVPAKYH